LVVVAGTLQRKEMKMEGDETYDDKIAAAIRHDPSLLLSKDEGRRVQALEMAIGVFGEEISAEDAADLVAVAKTFEAFLKGE
jgi:hypothetical protein